MGPEGPLRGREGCDIRQSPGSLAVPLGPGVGCKQLHLAWAPPTPWGLGALLWLQKGKRGWGGVRFPWSRGCGHGGGSADSWITSHLPGKFCGRGGAFFPAVVGQPGQSPRFQGQLCARPEGAGQAAPRCPLSSHLHSPNSCYLCAPPVLPPLPPGAASFPVSHRAGEGGLPIPDSLAAAPPPPPPRAPLWPQTPPPYRGAEFLWLRAGQSCWVSQRSAMCPLPPCCVLCLRMGHCSRTCLVGSSGRARLALDHSGPGARGTVEPGSHPTEGM